LFELETLKKGPSLKERIMARITVEDCLEIVNNRFELIHMASRRVRQLRKGAEPSLISKNRDIVVALREIAAGNIAIAEEGDFDNLDDSLGVAEGEETPLDGMETPQIAESPGEPETPDEEKKTPADTPLNETESMDSEKA
jgi:DNA-directed RNA polymerase subunit omega